MAFLLVTDTLFTVTERGDSQKDVCICFLVINQTDELPLLAITAAASLKKTRVIIGYVNPLDLPPLPISEKLEIVQLDPSAIPGLQKSLGDNYRDFANLDFYKIVQLKWQLISIALRRDFKYIIYADTDIVFSSDPIPAILSTFETRPKAEILIQSFTSIPAEPKLCMGFVAFRNTKLITNFISEAESRHRKEILSNPKVGDDDIVTMLYSEKGFPDWFVELPQSTFPVGNMLNLYIRKSYFPGLSSPKPFIFHANYVVGLQNKRLMTRIFMRDNPPLGLKVNLSLKWRFILVLKGLRLFFGTKRVQIRAFKEDLIR